MEDKNTCGIVDDHSGHRHKSDCCCRTEKDDRAEASRSCGHDTHSHEHTDNFHKGGCCEHEHHHGHHHKEACCCEHEHHREDTCGCGNEEHIEHRHDGGGCSCSHDHGDHHCHDDSGCGCGHDHSHEDPRQMKRELVTLAAGAGLLILGILVPGIFGMVTHIAAFLLVAWDILAGAVKNIRRGDIFGESFLMTIAGIGAVCIGEIPEGIMVFLLYRLGEYLQTKAVSSSRKSISALLDVRPDRANLLENGEVREVEADSVRVGSTILVRPGEKIPLDGVVISGDSQLDTSALTGEAMPREVGRGRQVMAGCINLNGALEICVERPFGESTASRILEMVEHAAGKKAVSEKFITRFARKYTPCVVAAAAVVAVLPPLMGFMAWRESLYSALCFLAISCPCALVISVPLSFFAGIGRASREGVLVKGGNHMETMAAADIIGFDKTGTLTKGRFEVREIIAAQGVEAQYVLNAAAVAESRSTHPVARSIYAAWKGENDEQLPDNYSEVPGFGVCAEIGGRRVLAGKAEYVREMGVDIVLNGPCEGTAVFVAEDDRYIGTILLRDTPKNDAATAIKRLKKLGIRHCAMLSGDREDVVQEIGRELGLDSAVGQLLPSEKLAQLDRLRGMLDQGGKLLYAGDGINDTPVLAAADLGIAMGGLGADAAIETADVIIMGDEPSKIASGIAIARQTVRIAKENIVFSIGVKLAVMLLAVLGHVELWAAVLADVGVCLLCVLNTLRITAYRIDNTP